ncbi:MAG TPA: hypothetical protein VL689_15245 [Paraburkholderia sp.]|jgi:hypothetical protein|nr:hypothetical protein [Paraburkholderia sp.]
MGKARWKVLRVYHRAIGQSGWGLCQEDGRAKPPLEWMPSFLSTGDCAAAMTVPAKMNVNPGDAERLGLFRLMAAVMDLSSIRILMIKDIRWVF